MAQKKGERRKPRREHELEMVSCNPLHAECTCGTWRYKADTEGLSEIDAIFHVQRWFENHRKIEARAP